MNNVCLMGWEDHFYHGQAMRMFYVYARDEQHAVKIANERRSMMIANGEWG